MHRSLRAAALLLLCSAICIGGPGLAAGQTRAVPSIRRVQVLRTRDHVEIEIEASDRVVPQANVITGPDRLIVDFVNAVPGAQLRNQAVNRGEVKSLRVGLFSKNPPVTRVVLDLNGPQPYQVFPSGRTVIVKVGGSVSARAAGLVTGPGSGAVLVNTSFAGRATQVTAAPPVPPLVVTFHSGLLTIHADKTNLSEVLFAVHERTGAEIAIPAGAEQEKVVGEMGPGPAPEVLSHLLNGSKFNFLILSSASDPTVLDRVILSQRPEGPAPIYVAQPQARMHPSDEADDEEPVRTVPAAPAQIQNPQPVPPSNPNAKAAADSEDPN